jgi:hypothetical protein
MRPPACPASAAAFALRRDGEQSRVFLVEQAEAFLEGHQHDGFTGGQRNDAPPPAAAGGKKKKAPLEPIVSTVDLGSPATTSSSSSDGASIPSRPRGASKGMDGVTGGQDASACACAFARVRAASVPPHAFHSLIISLSSPVPSIADHCRPY